MCELYSLNKIIHKYIIKFATYKKWKRDRYVHAPHILTKVIYHAIGMKDKLLKPIPQTELINKVQITA